ncbi:hypothetical protein TNCV_3048201 [Trichonephila clavipes]|nr:hypothetical protein TNCV_3048201 [Trichonephila clavipes]
MGRLGRSHHTANNLFFQIIVHKCSCVWSGIIIHENGLQQFLEDVANRCAISHPCSFLLSLFQHGRYEVVYKCLTLSSPHEDVSTTNVINFFDVCRMITSPMFSPKENSPRITLFSELGFTIELGTDPILYYSSVNYFKQDGILCETA